MNSLALLIPLSIVLLVGAGIAFFWAVNNGQFDDVETPGLLPLTDAHNDSRRAGPEGEDEPLKLP